jgi:DNA-binding transcriptional LysR family regulator
MNNLDANSLIIFHHVASSGSLTKAAEALGLSRSALSHRIKAIEARLGCQLLIRTTRSVSLTDAGYRLAAYAGRIADTLGEANLLANGLNQDSAGLLRISAPSGLGTVWLRPLIMAYMEANPLVSVDLRLNEFAVDITRDPFDLAIRVTSQPPENVVAKKLFGISWWLCASPELAARFAGELAEPDLAAIPVAGFARASHLHDIVLTRGKQKLLATRRRCWYRTSCRWCAMHCCVRSAWRCCRTIMRSRTCRPDACCACCPSGRSTPATAITSTPCTCPAR